MSDEPPSEELGLTILKVTPDLAEKFEIKSGQGVVNTPVKAGSVTDMANIKVGSVIFRVNRINIKNANEFNHALKNNSKYKLVLLLIQNANRQNYMIISWS